MLWKNSPRKTKSLKHGDKTENSRIYGQSLPLTLRLHIIVPRVERIFMTAIFQKRLSLQSYIKGVLTQKEFLVSFRHEGQVPRSTVSRLFTNLRTLYSYQHISFTFPKGQNIGIQLLSAKNIKVISVIFVHNGWTLNSGKGVS